MRCKVCDSMGVELLLLSIYKDYERNQGSHKFAYLFLRRRTMQVLQECPGLQVRWLLEYVSGGSSSLLRLVDSLSVMYILRREVYSIGVINPSQAPEHISAIQKRVKARVQELYTARASLGTHVVHPALMQVGCMPGSWTRVVEIMRRKPSVETFSRLLKLEKTWWGAPLPCSSTSSSSSSSTLAASAPQPAPPSFKTTTEITRDRFVRDRLFSYYYRAMFYGNSQTWSDREFLDMLGLTPEDAGSHPTASGFVEP